MLHMFRNASQSWVMRLFFGFLVVAFVFLWTQGDVNRIVSSDIAVATVGKEKINAHEFVRTFQREYRLAAATQQQKPEKEQLKYQVLMQMVTQSLLDQEVARLGLVATEDQVRQAIMSNPLFLNERKGFEKERYQTFLNVTQQSEREFVDSLKKDVTRQQLLTAITAGVEAPKLMVNTLYDWQYQERMVDFVFVPLRLFKPAAGTIKEDELESFYQANQAHFIIPEKRDATIMVMNAALLRENMRLSDEEIMAGFEKYKNEANGGVPSTNKRNEILMRLRHEKAQKKLHSLIPELEDALAGGETIINLAKQHGLKLQHLKDMTSTQEVKDIDPLDKEQKGRLQQEIFKIDGDAPQLVELGREAYAIVTVENKIPARTPPLSEIKDKILHFVQQQKQFQLAHENAKEKLNKISKGTLTWANLKGERKSTQKVSRQDMPKDLKIRPDFVNALMGMGLGEAAFTLTPEDVIFARPVKVLPINGALKQKELAKFQERVTFLLKNDIIEQYLQAAQKRYKVEYIQSVYNSI